MKFKNIFILLIFIILLVSFVSAAKEVVVNYYENYIEDPQAYVNSNGGDGIIVESGAKIVNSFPEDKGAISTLTTVQGDDGEELPGGNEKIFVNLKDLPRGSKILKDGSIVINEGETNEVKISNGRISKAEDGSFDIGEGVIEINRKEYAGTADSFKPLNLKFSDDKITLSSEDTVGQIDMINGNLLFDFVGSVSIYSDGHIDIEKGTYFSAYRNLGAMDIETWHIGEKETDQDGITTTYTGIAEKISYSNDINWKPSDDNQAYIKYYNDNGVETIDIENVDFILNMGIYESFFQDGKTNIISNAVENGEINIDISDKKGGLFIDNRGVNVMGDIADINLNSRYTDNNGETHNLIIDEYGTINICSECREVGRAFQRLDNLLKKRTESFSGNRIRLESSTIITEAYYTEDNIEVYRTNEDETFIIDLDSESVLYKKGNEDYKFINIDMDGKIKFSDKQELIGPITTRLIERENDAIKKGILPNGAYTLTPKVDLRMRGKMISPLEQRNAGDILVKDPAIKGIGSDVFRLDTDTGEYKIVASSWPGSLIDSKMSMTPSDFDSYMKGKYVEIIPYSYEGPYDAKAGYADIKIVDSRGNTIGTIKNEGEGMFAKLNVYGPDNKKIGSYIQLEDAKKAFEGRALHEWYSKPKTQSFGEGIFEDIQRAREYSYRGYDNSKAGADFKILNSQENQIGRIWRSNMGNEYYVYDIDGNIIGKYDTLDKAKENFELKNR